MYDKAIQRVAEMVYGPEKLNMGLSITKAANEAGIPVFKLAAELRSRRTAKDGAEQASQLRRTTVPNRMITHLTER